MAALPPNLNMFYFRLYLTAFYGSRLKVVL